MRVSSVWVAVASALLLPGAEAGMTPEDACAGLAENDECFVESPNTYTAYGTCLWTATATEAPSQTAAPNPANEVCLTLTPGEKCYFFDDTTQLDVEGVCRTSTVVGFSGLVCEPDGQSETTAESVCDSKSVGEACTLTKADGAKINGFCEDSGGVALKCEEARATAGPSKTTTTTAPINPAAVAPAEAACLVNRTDGSSGWLNPGDACSYTDASDATVTGSCVSKSGNAYFMCESDAITGGGNPAPDEAENPEYIACAGLATDEACMIVDPLTNDTKAGTCSTSAATGDLFCQPTRRRLNLYLKCHITSGGGEVTNKPPQTTTADLASAQQPVTFENTAGTVVGGVIGGLLALGLVVVGGIFLHRKYGTRRLDVDLDTEGGDVYQTL